MKNSPKVSVITPCYNRVEYLEETVDSVLAQTFQNFEIIIVDDGSTDRAAPETIRRVAKKDKRISCIFLEKNLRMAGARNAGIAKAKGTYILPLDSDDKIAPSYLEKTVNVMEKQNADIVYSHIQVFGEDDDLWLFPAHPRIKLPFRNCVPANSLFKKSAWKEVGGYSESMHQGCEDWDIWLSFVEADKKFILVDEVLFYYRLHDSNESRKKENIKAFPRFARQIKKRHPSLYTWKNYYFTWNYISLRLLPIRVFRRKAFRIRFNKKGQKIVRLFGITFLDKS